MVSTSAEKKVVVCVYGKCVDGGTKCVDSDTGNLYMGASLHSGSVDTVGHPHEVKVNPNPLICGSVDRATADAKASSKQSYELRNEETMGTRHQ